jgi:hypothetical protein
MVTPSVAETSPHLPDAAARTPTPSVAEFSPVVAEFYLATASFPTVAPSPVVVDTPSSPSSTTAETSDAMSSSPIVADSPECSSPDSSNPSPPPLPPNAIPVLVPVNDHGMWTHGKRVFHLPQHRLNLTATTPISPIPSTYKRALLDPVWLSAMCNEFDALPQNSTWSLVPKPSGVNVVSGKWVFRHKFHVDGTLSCYKTRWVCRGLSQHQGIDYEETFSLVVKPSTIRVVLSIAISYLWPLHQLDVKNAFLHGHLIETVYCQQLSGFENTSNPDHVCLLNKSRYGLK